MGKEVNILEQAQDIFAETMAKSCSLWGFPRLAGQIFGVLFFNEKPLSLDEISDRLKASKSNVSVSVRELQKWKSVKKVWIKGNRKDYYLAKTDFGKIMLDLMTSFFREDVEATTAGACESRRILEENLAYLSEEDKKKAKISIQRLKKIEEFYIYCKQFLENFLKFESSISEDAVKCSEK